MIRNLASLENLLEGPLSPLVRPFREGNQRPLHAGEIAGIVLQDFLAEVANNNTDAARLYKIVDDISRDLSRGGAMKNSNPNKIKKAWEEFKTVSHLWAAHNQFSDRDGVPAIVPSDQLFEFCAMSEMFRLRARRTATSRTGTLLDESSWTVPVLGF